MSMMSRTSSLNDRQRVAAGVSALVCGLTALFLVGWFFSHVNIPMPVSNDSVNELVDGLRGENLWQRMRHNNVASWFSSLGLLLDTEIGPYPVWSYFIGYLLLAIFLGFMATVSKASLGWPLAFQFCSLFALYWFLWMNTAQSFTYVWRIPEVGQQLALLGTGAFVIRYLDQLSTKALIALIFLSFIFSNTHAAYVIFACLLVILMFIDKSVFRIACYTLVLMSYILYMVFLDGTFVHFFNAFLSHKPSEYGFLPIIIAIFGLQSQVVGLMLSTLTVEYSDIIIRSIYACLLILMTAIALWRLVRRRNKDSGVFLFLVLSQLGIIVLAVLGRISEHGMGVMNFPRYSSYSVVTLFAVLWYVAVNSRRDVALILFIVVAAFGVLIAVPTTKKLSGYAKWFSHRHSKIYSVALSGQTMPFHEMDTREQTAFLSYLVDGLQARGAAGFGVGPWTAIKGLNPISHPSPTCGGRLKVKPTPAGSAYAVWDYGYSPSKHGAADFGYVLSATGVPVGLSPGTTVKGWRTMRFYVPSKSGGAILYLANLGQTRGNPPDILCEISPEKTNRPE